MSGPIGISKATNAALQSIVRDREARKVSSGESPQETVSQNHEAMLVAQAERSARQAARYVAQTRRESAPTEADIEQWSARDARDAMDVVERALAEDPAGAIEIQAKRIPRRSMDALLR